MSTAGRYVIGIGDPAARRRIDEHASALGLEPATLVHPSSTVGSDVVLGPGTILTAGVRVTTNVRTGRHVHLNLNSTVTHDCVLEDYVTVSPGANISGNVVLHEGATIGTGAAVIQGNEHREIRQGGRRRRGDPGRRVRRNRHRSPGGSRQRNDGL